MCWTLSSYCSGEKLGNCIVQNVIFFQFLLFIGSDHPTLYQLASRSCILYPSKYWETPNHKIAQIYFSWYPLRFVVVFQPVYRSDLLKAERCGFRFVMRYFNFLLHSTFFAIRIYSYLYVFWTNFALNIHNGFIIISLSGLRISHPLMVVEFKNSIEVHVWIN